MRPRVALFLPSLEDGGAERAFVQLANEFIALGVSVDFVLARLHGPFVAELRPEVRTIDLRTSRWLPAVVGLASYLRRTQPDVLMSGLDPANVAAVIASTLAGMRDRCVVSQRAVIRDVYRLERPRAWRVWLWLLGTTYRHARLVICNSADAAGEVRELGVHPGKVAVILNAVDMDRIAAMSRQRVDDPWLAASAPPLLVSVGSLSRRKNVGMLLRALAIVSRTRPCNLVILGEGPERARLEELRAALGLQDSVRMPGFTINPFPWMAGADMLLSASLAEGCPNVIQQALACGTPVVATDCPGATADVLEQGRWGRLVPVNDPEAMAAAIIAILDDPNLPDVRIRARDFAGNATARRYLHLLLPQAAVAIPRAEPAPSTA